MLPHPHIELPLAQSRKHAYFCHVLDIEITVVVPAEPAALKDSEGNYLTGETMRPYVPSTGSVLARIAAENHTTEFKCRTQTAVFPLS